MNLAVGGNYVGNPSLAAGTYGMQVDYVRAYTSVPEPVSALCLGGASLIVLRRRVRTGGARGGRPRRR